MILLTSLGSATTTNLPFPTELSTAALKEKLFNGEVMRRGRVDAGRAKGVMEGTSIDL